MANDDIMNAIIAGNKPQIKELLKTADQARSMFTVGHIDQAIQSYDKKQNTVLKLLIDDNHTKLNHITEHSVSTAIKENNVDALKLFIDKKQYLKFNESHVSELIEKKDSKGMLDPLLKVSRLDPVFTPKHISDAIEADRGDLLRSLSTKGKAKTAALISVVNAEEAINQYTGQDNSPLSVLLDTKDKLFTTEPKENGKKTPKEQGDNAPKGAGKKIPKDSITFAIKNNKNDALQLILRKKPELVKDTHLSAAIIAKNSTALESILQKKPQLLTPEHLTEATQTGDANTIDTLCTACFKTDINNRRAHPAINRADIKDRTLNEVAKHINTSLDTEHQGNRLQQSQPFDPKLIETMKDLMGVGANSNERFKNEDGYRATAQQLLDRVKDKDATLPEALDTMKAHDEAPRPILDKVLNLIVQRYPKVGQLLQRPADESSYRKAPDALPEQDRGLQDHPLMKRAQEIADSTVGKTVEHWKPKLDQMEASTSEKLQTTILKNTDANPKDNAIIAQLKYSYRALIDKRPMDVFKKADDVRPEHGSLKDHPLIQRVQQMTDATVRTTEEHWKPKLEQTEARISEKLKTTIIEDTEADPTDNIIIARVKQFLKTLMDRPQIQMPQKADERSLTSDNKDIVPSTDIKNTDIENKKEEHNAQQEQEKSTQSDPTRTEDNHKEKSQENNRIKDESAALNRDFGDIIPTGLKTELTATGMKADTNQPVTGDSVAAPASQGQKSTQAVAPGA